MIEKADPKIFQLLQEEHQRQLEGCEMIASENIVSPSVMELQGSIFTNKYAEGYPKKRYYGGCEVVDDVEQLAIDRLTQIYSAESANVQPHSGSQANMSVYLSELTPGDTILGMDLSHGGHLTHGSKVSFSGKIFQSYSYGVSAKDGYIDYDEVRSIALDKRPRLIVAGASSYSRIIDFKKFREIADEIEAILMIDMAHIAGLVAAKLHPTPVGHAHYVTSTTHKTLRGPRGGFVLSDSERIKKVNKTIFPGIQGGPLVHVIAAKAVSFQEALQKEYIEYQKQVIKNAQILAQSFLQANYDVVSGGTDNHLFLLNLSSKKDLTGKEAEYLLGLAGITVNKNTVPFEQRSPFVTSGIRIGSPALTTRGMKDDEMKMIAKWMIDILEKRSESFAQKTRNQVKELCLKFPLFSY